MVHLTSPPTKSVFIAEPLPRHPRVQVLAADSSPLQDVVVEAVVVSVELTPSTRAVDCSTSFRQQFEHTLEHLRLAEVCTPRLAAASGSSSDLGLVSLSQLGLASGPPGAWTLSFRTLPAPGVSPVSHNYTMAAASVVFDMFLQAPAPDHFVPGQPLSVQPTLVLYDQYGNTVTGRRVVAFVAQSPYLSDDTDEMERQSPQGQRFGTLLNEWSLPSDDNGVAVFDGLTVTGTSSPFVYLAFYCEGFTASWSLSSASSLIGKRVGRLLPSLPSIVKGMLARTPVCQVEVVVQPPESAVGGQRFTEQPVVRVTDGAGKPVVGAVVFALTAEASAFRYPYLLVPRLDGVFFPQLQHAVSTPTNASGHAVWGQLRYTSSGLSSSRFVLIFSCDGVVSEETRPVLVEVRCCGRTGGRADGRACACALTLLGRHSPPPLLPLPLILFSF